MNPKKILIAVDASDNAARAVDYVAQLLTDTTTFDVTVLYIERPPNRDFFPSDAEWIKAGVAQEEHIRAFLEESRQKLAATGLPQASVNVAYIPHCQSPVHQSAEFCSLGTSIARDILQFQQSGGFGTLVIGRRGVSRAEEFLFGSVTTKVTHLAKDCTVWVVQ
ncbi:MAG: universal stress protein [Deltaproteobacteria bacterium]|nr:universal stress protein [Deltaproteobacteria bacterium]